MDVLLLAGVLVAQPAPTSPQPETATPTEAEAPAVQPDESVGDPAEPDADAPEPESSDAETTDDVPPVVEQPAPSPAEEPVPESAPEPEPVPTFTSAQARDPEPSPLEERRDDDAQLRDEEVSRAGPFISLSVGAGHCGAWCSYLQAIGGGRFEAGYRWGHVALGGSTSIVAGTYDNAASDNEDIYFTVAAKGSTRFFVIGPVVQLFLAGEGRFDPYVSLGIGYRRAVDVATVEDVDGEVKYWESGVGVSVGAGIPVRVSERVTIGGRFDKTFAVGGKMCGTIGGNVPEGRERCETWSKQTADLNAIDKRFSRLTRPRPWTVGLELRVSF